MDFYLGSTILPGDSFSLLLVLTCVCPFWFGVGSQFLSTSTETVSTGLFTSELVLEAATTVVSGYGVWAQSQRGFAGI